MLKTIDTSDGLGNTTESLSGKKMNGNANSKFSTRIAVTGILIGLTASLGACTTTVNDSAPANPAEQNAAGDDASESASENYGSVIGSGKTITTEDGSYETVTLDPASDLFNLNGGNGLPEGIAAYGWTAEDATAAQKFAAEYVVHEYLDSTALETGDAGLEDWINTTAATYYSTKMIDDGSLRNSESGGDIVLGNVGEERLIPNLVHDGKPRLSNADLTLLDLETFAVEDSQALKFNIEYTADYRATDAGAVNAASYYAGQTPEAFLSSPIADPKLQDGVGENIHKAYGTVGVVVVKTPSDGWKIAGLQTDRNYSNSDYVL